MGLSSEQARQIQFSGTTTSYDGGEVEQFRRRVIAALEEHEAAMRDRPAPTQEELAEAQRVRHQAVELAERMLRDVMGAEDDQQGGLEAWQDAIILQAAAEEEMAFATEESRRLKAMAEAEADTSRQRQRDQRKQARTDLQNELQASRDAADAEAESMRAEAKEEATSIVQKAVARAQETQRAAADDAQRIERRLSVLHTALADAEARFRRLASTAANDIGTLEAIMSSAVEPPTREQPRPDLHIATVDLTDVALEETAEEDEARADSGDESPGMIRRDPDVGFYQRRLAGLRDRLEKSGHPPE